MYMYAAHARAAASGVADDAPPPLAHARMAPFLLSCAGLHYRKRARGGMCARAWEQWWCPLLLTSCVQSGGKGGEVNAVSSTP